MSTTPTHKITKSGPARRNPFQRLARRLEGKSRGTLKVAVCTVSERVTARVQNPDDIHLLCRKPALEA